MTKTLLIDGPSLFARSYFALRGKPDVEGESWGIWQMLNEVRDAVRRHAPDQMAVCWDGDNLERKKIYPKYKENREKPDGYYAQLVGAMQLLESCGYPAAWADGWEADDVIATLSRLYRPVVFISSDHDLLQLIDLDAEMELLRWSRANGAYREMVSFGDGLYWAFDVPYRLLADYKALMGDKSDNIDGIAGIGKQAAKLICNVLGSLEHGLEVEVTGQLSGISVELQELLGRRIAKRMFGQWEKAIWIRDNLIRLNDQLEGLSVGPAPDERRVGLGVSAHKSQIYKET